MAATNRAMIHTCDYSDLFARWVGDHRGIVVKVARVYAATPAAVAELEQELLLQIWRSLPAFAGQSKPSTWIYRVRLNTALTWRRGTQRRERRFAPECDVANVPGEAHSPADAASERELLERLYTAIHSLRASDRALVLLSLDGLLYREIAEVTGLTENHVGVALTNARKRLAQILKGVAHELQ